ncbi:MAG: geranylgeranylglycerol-phosphate geranylgeranyltransferase [Thermoplasmata archaeon]|nr:geranylgeranylglycerol-phosphate geranylgeranyltransferase [Thermoplasmata archaeon]
MHPLLRLVRAGNLVVAFAGTFVAGLDVVPLRIGFPFATALGFVLAAASTTLVTAGGNVLNDLLDRDSDRVNHPDRPLVTGAVRTGTARALVVGCFVVAGLLILPLSLAHPALPAIYLLAVAGLIAYEFRLKATGLPGNLVVAGLTGAVFLYGGAAGGDIVLVVPFVLMATLATFSREVIKDMEDLAGDVDRRTFPRTHGLRASGVVARVSVAVAVVLSVAPFFTFLAILSVAGIMYLVSVGVADALFVASVAWLPARLHWEQSVSKGAMAVALLAFLAAAVR